MKIFWVVSVSILLLLLTGCTTQQTSEPVATTLAEIDKIDNKGDEMSVTELLIEDMVLGTGAEAVDGKIVSVHYTGTLTDGTVFDSSVSRKVPFEFTLGAGEVIKGWDQGIKGMKVGGKRKLTIPADLAYGDRGAGNLIPPKSTLVFEVELLGIE